MDIGVEGAKEVGREAWEVIAIKAKDYKYSY
jgi:hypothetical protein